MTSSSSVKLDFVVFPNKGWSFQDSHFWFGCWFLKYLLSIFKICWPSFEFCRFHCPSFNSLWLLSGDFVSFPYLTPKSFLIFYFSFKYCSLMITGFVFHLTSNVESSLYDVNEVEFNHYSCRMSNAFGQISGLYVKITLRNSFAA